MYVHIDCKKCIYIDLTSHEDVINSILHKNKKACIFENQLFEVILIISFPKMFL